MLAQYELVGSARGNVDTSNTRNALLEIVGDIELIQVVTSCCLYSAQRESAFIADRMGNE